MNNQHDAIAHEAAKRMFAKGTYETIDEFVEYEGRGRRGEFDAIGVRHSGICVYLEAKSHYSHRSETKARAQFERTLKAYPEYDWRFILVTPERVRLYHPNEVVENFEALQRRTLRMRKR